MHNDFPYQADTHNPTGPAYLAPILPVNQFDFTPDRSLKHAFGDYLVELTPGSDDRRAASDQLLALTQALRDTPELYVPDLEDPAGRPFGQQHIGDTPMVARWRIDPAQRRVHVYDCLHEDELKLQPEPERLPEPNYAELVAQVTVARMDDHTLNQERARLTGAHDRGEGSEFGTRLLNAMERDEAQRGLHRAAVAERNHSERARARQLERTLTPADRDVSF